MFVMITVYARPLVEALVPWKERILLEENFQEVLTFCTGKIVTDGLICSG